MTTFTAPLPNPPSMNLRARLAYICFFGDGNCYTGGWACAHTQDGCWIVTDESCDLTQASIYPDDDSFIEWLESVATEHLEDDRVEFFKLFCSVKELVNDEVARAMERLL